MVRAWVLALLVAGCSGGGGPATAGAAPSPAGCACKGPVCACAHCKASPERAGATRCPCRETEKPR